MPRKTRRGYTQKGKGLKRKRSWHHTYRSVGMRESMRWLMAQGVNGNMEGQS